MCFHAEALCSNVFLQVSLVQKLLQLFQTPFFNLAVLWSCFWRWDLVRS